MLAVLLGALALDLALGEPPNRWHPVAWLGRLLGTGQRALCRGGARALLVRGAAITVGAAAVAALVGVAVVGIANWLGPPGVILEALALKSTFSLHRLVAAARDVAAHLARGDLGAARVAVGRDLVSRPTSGLDQAGVASAVVESVAENFTDSFVAPVCFFLVFGLPGALVYRAVNTADAMLGYRGGALEHFGKVAARLDDALNFVPSRLAAGWLVLGAALSGADARRALQVMWRDAGKTASPNAGWTMAAMAGALGVTLEKPGAYRLGAGRDPAPADIGRAVRVMALGAAIATIVTISVVTIASRYQ